MFKSIAIVFVCSGITADVFDNGTQWDPSDENTWSYYFCKEGKLQSPIDINADKVIEDYDRKFIRYGHLKFKRYDNVLVTGVNNGHTIKFVTESVGKVLPSVSGGPLKEPYHLKEVSFHWLSEHSVNGYKYPMEIHMVHARSHFEMSEALHKRHGLAVISILCNVTEPLDSSVRYDVEDVMEYLPKLMHTGDRVKGLLIHFRNLLLPYPGSYYTYLGSLTAPECNEVVVWIIFKNPMHIPADIYKQLTQAGRGHNNFRSLQKINRHIVYEPPKRFIVAPDIFNIFVDTFNMVANFFRNITSALKKGRDPPSGVP